MTIVNLLKEKSNFVALGAVGNSEIKDAESALKTKFSSDYRDILLNYGVVSFHNHELTGICKSKRLNVVDVTIEERKNNEYADNLYVLEKANIDDIIIWQSSNGQVYQTKGNSKPIKLCESLIEYLV